MKSKKIGLFILEVLQVGALGALAALYWFKTDNKEGAYITLGALGVFILLSIVQVFAKKSNGAFAILSVIKHAVSLCALSLGVLPYFFTTEFKFALNYMPMFTVFDDFLLSTITFAGMITVLPLAAAEAKCAFGTKDITLKVKWWQLISVLLVAGACVYAYIAHDTYSHMRIILAAYAFLLLYICQLTLGSGAGGQKFLALIKFILAMCAAALLIWHDLEALLANIDAAADIFYGNIILLAVAGAIAIWSLLCLIFEFKQIKKAS